jgi:hypothetical protein
MERKREREKNGAKEGSRKSIKKETTQYFHSKIGRDTTGKLGR